MHHHSSIYFTITDFDHLFYLLQKRLDNKKSIALIRDRVINEISYFYHTASAREKIREKTFIPLPKKK